MAYVFCLVRNCIHRITELDEINFFRSGSVKSESEFAVGRSSERLSGSSSTAASGGGSAQAAEDAAGDGDALMRRSGSDETSDDILAKYRKKATNR